MNVQNAAAVPEPGSFNYRDKARSEFLAVKVADVIRQCLPAIAVFLLLILAAGLTGYLRR